jgi:hypothetical protein
MLEARMAFDRTSNAYRRIVIDDHCRLPARFFGRFATSATSALTGSGARCSRAEISLPAHLILPTQFFFWG